MASVHPHSDERLAGGYTGRLLGSVAFGTTTIFVTQLVVPPLLPTIIEDLGITPFLAGIALSVMWGLTAVLQYPGGRASDDLSRKTVLAAAAGSIVVGSLALWWSSDYLTFLLGVAAIGVGAGLYHPVAFALLADVFVDRRGQAYGINAGSSDLGGILASALAVAVLAAATWRTAFLPTALGGLALLAAMHRWNAESYSLGSVELDLRGTAKQLVGIAQMRWVLAAFTLFMFVYQGTTSFLPTLLRAEKGFSPTLANNAFALLFVAGLVSKPVAGRLGDRVSRTLVATAGTVLAAAGIAAFLAFEDAAIVLAGIFVFASGLGAFWPVMIAYVMSLFPDTSMGGDLGAVRSAAFAIGSLGSSYVGFVAERASYTLAFWGFVACLVLAIVITGWVSWRYE